MQILELVQLCKQNFIEDKNTENGRFLEFTFILFLLLEPCIKYLKTNFHYGRI